VNQYRQSFKDFLDAVCAIPVERTNVILPASYSTPITILGRLSPLGREGFPSLPYLIDHPRNFAALVKLWTESQPRGSMEGREYDGDLLVFHDLCLALQQRVNDCSLRVETLRLAETGSHQTEDHLSLSDTMEYMSIGDVNPSSYSSSTLWLDQDARPVGSSGSEMDSPAVVRDARFGGRDLSTLRQVSGSSDVSAGGTIRNLRNGRHARKFLSGFMRRRAASPVPYPATTTPAVTDTYHDREGNTTGARMSSRDREHKEADRDRNRVFGAFGSSTRHQQQD
jgi:hypothetical protein